MPINNITLITNRPGQAGYDNQIRQALIDLSNEVPNLNTAATDAITSALIATTAVNYIGEWIDATKPVDAFVTVTHNGAWWASNKSTSEEPSSIAVDWQQIYGYDNTTSGLTATTLPEAIDEVEARLDTAEIDITTLESDVALKLNSVIAGSGILVNATDINNPTISAVPTAAAGILSRLYATGDTTILTSGTYYLAGPDKGTVASIEQTVAVDDGIKTYFSQDYVSAAVVEDTTYYAGVYSGVITVKTDDATDNQLYTIEVYKADVDGVVIDSGLASEVIGDLGVKPLVVLSTGTISPVAGILTNVLINGVLSEQSIVLATERIRFHVSAEKVGIAGGIATLSLFGGYDNSSYIDVPVAVTTSSVINKSSVAGATSTDALNSLNSLKADQVTTYTKIEVDTALAVVQGNALAFAIALG